MFNEDFFYATCSVPAVQVLLGAALPARACDGGGLFHLSKVFPVKPWPPQGHVWESI